MEEIKTIGGHQLPRGADGGHYTPVVTQTAADTMTVEFQPSKAGMAAVEPVKIKLPVGSGSGQNLELDATLTKSGKAADAKAVGDALSELEEKIPEGGANYTLPVANASILGGVMLPPKTAAHTEAATVDEDGRVWVKPPAQSVSEVGGVEFVNYTGNLYSSDNRLIRLPAVGDNVLALTGGSQKYVIFRAKPGTTYVITATSIPSVGNMGRANSLGVCTQAPTASGKPVDQIGFMSAGGYGQYFIIKTNELFGDDDAYLIWQASASADFSSVAIYEGDSIEGYDTINAYSDLNGTATSNDLIVRSRNLSPDISEQLRRSGNAVQPEALRADVSQGTPLYNALPSTQMEVGESALGMIHTLVNSAVVSDAVNKTRLKLGSHYAHCPSVNVVGGKAYVSAFENTESTVDSYELPGVNTHLFVVDITSMSQEAEYIVAQHGDTVEGLTFAYGSGACQSIMIDATTLRTVFVAKLRDVAGVDEWYQCYRDFNVSTNEFGPIGLCQLRDSEGGLHPFTTANASLYIQEIDNPVDSKGQPINTNIVCQSAKIGSTWYVPCGCQNRWQNIPILITEDWISFRYWTTPEAEGNAAHYEMAIITDGSALYTATRQTTAGKVIVAKVPLNYPELAADPNYKLPIYDLPDGNCSRPAMLKSGNKLRIAHILTADRQNSSQITELLTGFGSQAQYDSALVTLPPMVYPAFAELDDGYFVAYMVPYALYCSKIPKLDKYSHVEATAIAAKLVELVGG